MTRVHHIRSPHVFATKSVPVVSRSFLTYTDDTPTFPLVFKQIESKTMRDDVNERMVEVQDLLEDGLQRCLGLTRRLMRRLETKATGALAFRLLTNDELSEELTHVARELYKVIAETLFRLIEKLQPEDCADGRAINFYFWPGYHSVLIKQRIFYRHFDDVDEWNFGVGICGRPGEKPRIYHDSCQARLYHFLIKHRKKSKIVPLDIHQLALRRVAEDHDDDLPRFIVVTNKPIPAGGTKKNFCQLKSDRSTESWGQQFASFVWNEKVLGKLLNTDPRTTDQGSFFERRSLNKLQSLWFHSAFCNINPSWLPSFLEDLNAHPDGSHAYRSLRDALADKIASDWGDGSEHRPLFSTWAILSLSSWLDPRDILITKETKQDKKPNLASKTVGSAAFLSSIPLSPLYLAFAKHWVSEVYNAIRNTEMAMLVHNEQNGMKEAFAAGPYFAHEIQTLVDRALPTVQESVADDHEQVVRRRRFVLYSIRTLCTLAYSFTNVVTFPTEFTIKEEADKLLDPLRKLRYKGVLERDLTAIAIETYENLKRRDGGTISFCNPPQSYEISANDIQRGACFLLLVELIRNYCGSKRSGPTASFRTSLDGDTLVVELKGSTDAQKNPTSMSFARLDLFLRFLRVGTANIEWYPEFKSFTGTVHVNLKTESLPHHPSA